MKLEANLLCCTNAVPEIGQAAAPIAARKQTFLTANEQRAR